MVNFKGFNTVGQHKKFTLTDIELVKRDLNNAFLIRAGTVPGKPEVGTVVWDYIFEPADTYTAKKIDTEVRRLVDLDTRIELHDIKVELTENIVNVYLSVSLHPSVDVEEFYIIFNKEYQTAEVV